MKTSDKNTLAQLQSKHTIPKYREQKNTFNCDKNTLVTCYLELNVHRIFFCL